MKTQLKNLAGLFKDTRTRTIIIFTALIVVFAIVVAIVRLTKASPDAATANSQLQGTPGIQSIPGGFGQDVTSEEYARLQEQQNELQAKIAAKQGGSAIPTIIRASSFEQQATNKTANTGCCNSCCTGGAGKSGNVSLQASTLAPGTLVYDAQGRVIGVVGADGKVRDASGKILGTVGPDGLVRDANGNVIGSAAATAAGTPVFDGNGKLTGTIGTDGKVRDAQGNIVGTVDPDGTVRDMQGNVIGKAGSATQGTPVYDDQGRLLGTVSADGKVRDSKGNVIGAVGPDGTVRDGNGKIIGKANSSNSGAPVYDADGRLIGTVGADGKVHDADGNVIGAVGADGTVRDLNGKMIGKTSSSTNLAGTPVYDAQGRLIGTVGPDGKVRDANGNVIGVLGSDGFVRDANGKIIGQIHAAGAAEGSPAYDNQGRLLGTVGADGKVRDAKGNLIGTVGPDGVLRDANGNILGKASKVVPGSPVYNAQGRLLGTVGADGKVRDANGKVIGVVGADGITRDANGQVIGQTGSTAPGKPVYDAQGRLIGTVGVDGVVRDSNGRAIGTAGMDGSVRDIGGQIIGSTAEPGSATAGQQTAATAAQQLTAIPDVQGANQQGQNAQLQAILQRQAAQISQQQAEQVKAQMQSAIASQANQLFTAWSSPVQQYVEATPTNGNDLGVNSGGRRGANANGNSQLSTGELAPIVKAGTIMYGVLTTAVNSDEPGPILATIVDGKFKGGKLLGALTNQGQKVLLSFNLLTMPNISRSIGVNVVAIDQNTARTAFSSYTDNHYLLRYGTLFASSFLQGYGQAFQTSGQTVISNGLQTNVANPDLDANGKFFVALGKVGEKYSTVLNDIFNTPPTVYVNSGTALGVLFLADVPPLPAT